MTDTFMNFAIEQKKLSKNKRYQVGAYLTNGISSHNTHLTEREHPDTTQHAEARIISESARLGIATQGHKIYITLSPCVSCAKLIIQSGITHVYYQELDEKQEFALELLESAGIYHEKSYK